MTTEQMSLIGKPSRISNKFPGDCSKCGNRVAAGKGYLTHGDNGWVVTHDECPKIIPSTRYVPEVDMSKWTPPQIPEGKFTVVFEDGGHRTIKVHQQGSYANFMPNMKVLSYLSGPDNSSDFRSFANIEANGAVRIWKKFRGADRLEEAVKVLQGDPIACLKAYGLRSGHCGMCGRELTDPDSIKFGIGPVCRGRL